MSVVIDAICVVVRVSKLEEQYPGGVEAYAQDWAKRIFCEDGNLTRISFMSPVDVRAFIKRLQARHSLKLTTEEDTFADIAVVDQNIGPTRPCPWIHFERDPEGLSRCWLEGTDPGEMVVPEGWSVEGRQSMKLIPNEEMAARRIERSGNLDVFFDESGEARYIGRPFEDVHEAEDLFRRAKRMEESGQLVDASRLYEQALSVQPENPNLWYSAGVLRGRVESPAAAIPLYRKALELDPQFQVAASNLGAALTEVGLSDEGIVWLRRAVDTEPSDPIARWNLATELERSKSAESVSAFQEFMRVATTDADTKHDWTSALSYAASRATQRDLTHPAPSGLADTPQSDKTAARVRPEVREVALGRELCFRVMSTPKQRALRALGWSFYFIMWIVACLYVFGSFLAYLVDGRGVWKLAAFAQPVCGLLLPIVGHGDLFGVAVRSPLWWVFAIAFFVTAGLSMYGGPLQVVVQFERGEGSRRVSASRVRLSILDLLDGCPSGASAGAITRALVEDGASNTAAIRGQLTWLVGHNLVEESGKGWGEASGGGSPLRVPWELEPTFYRAI